MVGTPRAIIFHSSLHDRAAFTGLNRVNSMKKGFVASTACASLAHASPARFDPKQIMRDFYKTDVPAFGRKLKAWLRWNGSKPCDLFVTNTLQTQSISLSRLARNEREREPERGAPVQNSTSPLPQDCFESPQPSSALRAPSPAPAGEGQSPPTLLAEREKTASRSSFSPRTIRFRNCRT